MATAGSSSKKRRESYRLEFKLNVLEEMDKNCKKTDTYSQFSLAKPTLSTSISQRPKLEELQHNAGLKRKCARSAQYSSVVKAVLVWFKQCVAMKVPVNGPLMSLKANELARELDIESWEASDIGCIVLSIAMACHLNQSVVSQQQQLQKWWICGFMRHYLICLNSMIHQMCTLLMRLIFSINA